MDYVTIPNVSKITMYIDDELVQDITVPSDTRQFDVDVECKDTNEVGDDFHTFGDLYNQRLYLSAALAKMTPAAWKSKLHANGKKPFGGEWFVMGFNTPKGHYTYHYPIKYWDLFECHELERAPEWDKHMSKDVDRLLSIPTELKVKVTSVDLSKDEAKEPAIVGWYENYDLYGLCPNCYHTNPVTNHYCSHCGTKLKTYDEMYKEEELD